MKLSGTASLNATPQQVWDAVHDPAVLARCLPGCQQLTVVGTHEYAMTVTAGVSAVRGTYDGRVRLSNHQPPQSFTLTAVGAGAPGTVDADVMVRLVPSATGGTEVTYQADATVGGPIGGVGQRMLVGVTRKMAGEFFTAVDDEVFATPEPATATPAPLGESAATPGTGEVSLPEVYAGRVAARARQPSRVKDVALGAAVGGLVALAGVIVGWSIGGR